MPAARPHLLYIAWGFPPCRGSGVYRALATANAFARQDWDVTVVTADREMWFRYTGADTSLEDRVDRRVRVERVPFEWPGLEPDIAQWSAMRVYAPRLWLRYRSAVEQMSFPEKAYGPWLTALKKAVTRIHRDRPVDLTLATANPHVTFGAAYELKAKAGVPYVVDYRDAWSLDVFSGDRLYRPSSRVGRTEGKLLSSATEIWFVNEPIRSWHQAEYPSAARRMHTVANGFDLEFVTLGNSRQNDTERPLRFGYLGTVSTQVPLDRFVAGWEAARKASPDLAAAEATIRGHLGHYLASNASTSRLLANARDSGIYYEGPVKKLDVQDFYRDVDILLLILGAGRYVTSGKVFEYLATGLPIVSVHEPGSAAESVLADYPRWHRASSLEPSDVTASLISAARDRRSETPETRTSAIEYAAGFDRVEQLRPRITALHAYVGGSVGASA